MVVGEDVAGGGVGADDEAGAGHGVLYGVAEHVGGHAAVDAHHGAQIGGVDLLRGEDGMAVHLGQIHRHAGGAALIDGGGAAGEVVVGQHAAAAGQAADEGAAQAQGHKPGRSLPLLLLGGLGLIDVELLGLDRFPILRDPVIITVIHICSLLFTDSRCSLGTIPRINKNYV